MKDDAAIDDNVIFDQDGNAIGWSKGSATTGTNSFGSQGYILSPSNGKMVFRNSPNLIIEYAYTCKYCNDIIFKTTDTFGPAMHIKKYIEIQLHDLVESDLPFIAKNNKCYICWDCFKNMAPDDIIAELEKKDGSV